MADTPAPYVPYLPQPGGPGYTVTPSPSAPRSSPAPVYVPADTTGNQGYAAAGVTSLAAARAKKDALTKAQKKAIAKATRLAKAGKFGRAGLTLGKSVGKRIPYVGWAVAIYSFLPSSARKALNSLGIGLAKDYVSGYRYSGGTIPNRRPLMAPHTVSASNKFLKDLQKSLPAPSRGRNPRAPGRAGLPLRAGLPRAVVRPKISKKVAEKSFSKAAPKVSTGRMPSIPTAPMPRASAPRAPTLKAPRASPTLPAFLSPLLTALTTRNPKIPKLPLTPNNPVSVASPFISSPPLLGFSQALAPQTSAQKCGCKRRKKKGCGSGHFKIGADGRETYTYWSKSKCQPSKLKSLSRRAGRIRTSSRVLRSSTRGAARR